MIDTIPLESRVELLEDKLDAALADIETLTDLLVGLIRHSARTDPQTPFAMASLLHQIARKDEATANAIKHIAPDAPANSAISANLLRTLAARLLAEPSGQ